MLSGDDVPLGSWWGGCRHWQDRFCGGVEFSRSQSVHVVRFEFGDIDHLFKIISDFDNINLV